MNSERPETIQEWEAYVDSLAGDTLRSQTAAVNSMAFMRTMKDEGHNADHCQEILMLFVRQCRMTSTGLPRNGMWDLSRLAIGDDLASLGAQMSEEEAEEMEAVWSKSSDDIDQFCLEADYEIDESV